MFAEVVPRAGIATKISFADSIARLAAAGVIDPPRYRGYAGDLLAWVERVLLTSSDEPIVFNRETATHLLTLLWAIGLANRAAFNVESPIASSPACASPASPAPAGGLSDGTMVTSILAALTLFR